MRTRNGWVVAGLLAGAAACGGEERAPGASAAAPAAPARADTLSLEERRRIPGSVAFISEAGGGKDVHRVRPDGSAEERLAAGPLDEFNGPGAPDGGAVVVTTVARDGGGHLERMWAHPVGAGRARALGAPGPQVRHPSWSPDGEWLVFQSSAASFGDLYRVRRDGTGLRRLTDNPEGNFEPAVSPDGAWVAFVSSRDSVAELYRMRPDGTGQERLTRTRRDEWAPRWSPDGRLLAFLSDRTGCDRVWVMAPDGSSARRLSGAPDDEYTAEADPAWSPTGRAVAYTFQQRGVPSRVYVHDLVGGRRAEVRVPGGGTVEDPAWSPDGRHLVVTSTRGGRSELYLARADGSGATRIAGARGSAWNPVWLPSR
ncbi:MAG TPA: hypothetical protein VF263_00665 [Longimicrobiaceae bacterium]